MGEIIDMGITIRLHSTIAARVLDAIDRRLDKKMRRSVAREILDPLVVRTVIVQNLELFRRHSHQERIDLSHYAPIVKETIS